MPKSQFWCMSILKTHKWLLAQSAKCCCKSVNVLQCLYRQIFKIKHFHHWARFSEVWFPLKLCTRLDTCLKIRFHDPIRILWSGLKPGHNHRCWTPENQVFLYRFRVWRIYCTFWCTKILGSKILKSLSLQLDHNRLFVRGLVELVLSSNHVNLTKMTKPPAAELLGVTACKLYKPSLIPQSFWAKRTLLMVTSLKTSSGTTLFGTNWPLNFTVGLQQSVRLEILCKTLKTLSY